MCGRTIGPADTARYRVYVEIEEHTADEEEPEYEDGYDQFDGLAQYEQSEQPAEDQLYRSFKFDLCPECVENYVREPLPKSLRTRVSFNSN
jgi:hypothetical protein